MSDAARLEALGAEHAEFLWRGTTFRVWLNLERWPTRLIRAGRRLDAVDVLLDGQELDELALLDDYREISNLMADAVGVAQLPETPDAPDEWFGGVPTLMRLVEDHEDDVASDLRRFWNVRYAERFAGNLTLREVWTYIRRLPSESAIARANNGGNEVWTESLYIQATLYQVLTGKPYPGRPLKPEEVERALEAMQAAQAHKDKLRERQAAWEPPPPAPVASAMELAIANRRRELGLPDEDGNQQSA